MPAAVIFLLIAFHDLVMVKTSLSVRGNLMFSLIALLLWSLSVDPFTPTRFMLSRACGPVSGNTWEDTAHT